MKSQHEKKDRLKLEVKQSSNKGKTPEKKSGLQDRDGPRIISGPLSLLELTPPDFAAAGAL